MWYSSNRLKQAIILAFPIYFLSFFFLFPLLHIFSLGLGVEISNDEFFTLSFIQEVISRPLNQYFLYWDIQQALITTFFCLLIGIPGSYILAHYKIPAKSTIRNILTIPFILPPIVVLIGFIEVFGHGSTINRIWLSITGSYLIEIYNSYEGILLAHIFYNIPVVIRLVEIGWKNINPETIDVAKSLKASRWQIFSKIQFPQLLPVIAAAALLVFIYAFNSFAIVLVLGGVQYQTLEVRIYSLALGEFAFNAAAALTIIQILINIIVIAFYLYYTKKYSVPTEQMIDIQEKGIYNPINRSQSLITFSLVLCYFTFLSLISILPLIGVLTASFTDSNGYFTISNYTNLFDINLRSYIGILPFDMIVNTLIFGMCVMILSVVLSLLLNYGLYHESIKNKSSKLNLFQSVSSMIIILPLGISSITLAFALFSLYHVTPLYDNISIVIIIAQTLIAFPFAYRIISTGREKIDPNLLLIARTLGASRLKTFLKIEIPLLLPSIIVAALFSFAISVGEFGATSFLARAQFATIPIGIYRLISTRNIGAAAAFSSILVLITVISFITLEKIGQTELKV